VFQWRRHPFSFRGAEKKPDQYTKDCLVVGSSSDETIVDNGTGNNVKTAMALKNLSLQGMHNFNQLRRNVQIPNFK
jgi:hypothetical protein